MSDLIPDSSELQSVLNKCHGFVFLFSPAMYMRKNLKVLEEKKKKKKWAVNTA